MGLTGIQHNGVPLDVAASAKLIIAHDVSIYAIRASLSFARSIFDARTKHVRLMGSGGPGCPLPRSLFHFLLLAALLLLPEEPAFRPCLTYY